MYHPRLKSILLESQLIGLNNPIAMIVVSPLKMKILKVNELLESHIYNSSLKRAFDYYEKHLNPNYEFGIGDICNFRRWLFSTLPNFKRRSLDRDEREAIYRQANLRPIGRITDYVIGRTGL